MPDGLDWEELVDAAPARCVASPALAGWSLALLQPREGPRRRAGRAIVHRARAASSRA